jgi:glutamine synthetase
VNTTKDRMKKVRLEYVWIDGCQPWGMRSKIKIHELSSDTISLIVEENSTENIPMWGFDGSSTNQANGNNSDCLLSPAYTVQDPLRRDGLSFIVLCEVLDSKGMPHTTNSRSPLTIVDSMFSKHEPAFGMEQEYTMTVSGRPIGFPEGGYPAPQGIYYCSAGSDRAFGRPVSDEHLDACIYAGLDITGTNAEVMPGQWEYQIGGPAVGALSVSDQLWVSRWLLLKIAEGHGMAVTFEPKPVMGDWNGAGCHANFSTKSMRTAPDGLVHIEQACKKMASRVAEHLKAYGPGIELRLTGDHETCSYDEFRWGVADRTASVRIPLSVSSDGYGYLEDRRPNANCDPYEVCKVMLETICSRHTD